MWKTNKEEELRWLFDLWLNNIEIAEVMWTTEDAIRNKLKRLWLVRQIEVHTPKVLLLDIETSLMEVYSFWIHEQIIWIDQIKNDWNIICWSAKWLFDDEIMSDSLTSKEAINKDDKRIVTSLWELLDEADVIIAHNGDHFDIPKARTRFLKHWLNNPSPFQTIDTLKIARKEFKVTSNKLDYLCRFLWLNVKVETGWIELWKQCWMWNEEAIETMSNYCDNDVLILEELYLKIRSYASLHTNLWMYVESDVPVCPKCLSTELVWGLKYYTGVNEYSAARCKCGAIVRMPVSKTSKNKKARLLK